MTTTNNLVDSFAIGDDLTIDHQIRGLNASITAAELGIKLHTYDATPTMLRKFVFPTLSFDGQITAAGNPQTDGTLTAEVQFHLSGDPGGDTSAFPIGRTLWGFIRAFSTASAVYTSEVFPILPTAGGADG